MNYNSLMYCPRFSPNRLTSHAYCKTGHSRLWISCEPPVGDRQGYAQKTTSRVHIPVARCGVVFHLQCSRGSLFGAVGRWLFSCRFADADGTDAPRHRLRAKTRRSFCVRSRAGSETRRQAVLFEDSVGFPGLTSLTPFLFCWSLRRRAALWALALTRLRSRGCRRSPPHPCFERYSRSAKGPLLELGSGDLPPGATAPRAKPARA